MNPKYYIEISDGPSAYCHFAFFDTDEYLSFFLFSHLRLDVEIEEEYVFDGAPYQLVQCRVPASWRDVFLRAMDLLPALMAYAGKTDYEDFCRGMILKARISQRERGAGITPLQ